MNERHRGGFDSFALLDLVIRCEELPAKFFFDVITTIGLGDESQDIETRMDKHGI